MRIFTHLNVDLDATCSVWAARKYIPGAQQGEVEFRRADWNGEGMSEEDLALDLDAGGRGWKGEKREDGKISSCFGEIIARHAPANDQLALAPLVKFVEAQDAYGNAVEHLVPQAGKATIECLAATSLNAVLRAFQALYPRDDRKVVEKMSEVLDGILEQGRLRARAVREADGAQWVGPKVAIIRNATSPMTNGVLFERGARVVVYVDGHNLGVIRAGGESLRMDHPELRAVVEKAGETNEWYAHPAGFLYCRGSRKSPATTLTKVNPVELAETVARLLG
jgi:hypothetical protein